MFHVHDGQQYISFVDSRQAAAKATLKQNLEQVTVTHVLQAIIQLNRLRLISVERWADGAIAACCLEDISDVAVG